MNFNTEYDVDISELKDFVRKVKSRITKDNLTNLEVAVRSSVEIIKYEWIKTAESKFKHSQGGYAQGIIDGVEYPFNEDTLHYRIKHTKDYALYLERGFASFDMKKALDTSLKVRVNKNGIKYLIIPFRFGAPNTKSMQALPSKVYNVAKKLKPSYITHIYEEGSQQGAKNYMEAQERILNNPIKVKRYSYKWGERLSAEGELYHNLYRFEKNPNLIRKFEQVSHSNIKTNQFVTKEIESKIDYVGKFINETNKLMQYSNFITFRTMSEISDGWIHLGIKPMKILEETVNSNKDRILNIQKMQ